MSATLMTALAIVGIGLVYGIFPIVAETWFRYRRPRVVRCPETRRDVAVWFDARHAALTAVPGPVEVRVHACALWPEREGCAHACAAQAEV
jgi:hypothetical protein